MRAFPCFSVLPFVRHRENRTNQPTEDEKKAVAPLLGKLYISPTSTEEKTRAVYEEISEAVESQLLSDATSRNALYKIHVSLGKIVNNLDQAAAAQMGSGAGHGRRSTSRATSLGVDDRTVLVGGEDRTVLAGEDRTIVEQIKEEDEDETGVLDDPNDTDADEVADGTTIQMTALQTEDDSLTDDLLEE